MNQLGVLISCVILVSHSYGSSAPPVYDTIVIGLGASGTAAAATLAQAGKKVLALEAQNRLGGRVNTVPFGDGVVELGAEWIHGTELSSVYELAVQNNVSVLPQDLFFDVYQSDGSSDRKDIIIDLTNTALEFYDDPPKDPEPMDQFITRKIHEYINTKYPAIRNDTEFIESFLEFMDLVIDNYESSSNWNDVTTDNGYEELGGNQYTSWHTNGYKTVFDILLNKYKNGPGYPTLNIKLNTEVTRIEWPQSPADSVVVTVRDGTTYTARTAIVTVSVGVLKERYENLFSPALPQQKSDAIKAISMGLCNKIIFRFATAWWAPATMISFVWRRADKAALSDEDKWLSKINGAGETMATRTAISLWACGDAAKTVEALPEDVVRTKVLGLIRKFMGKNRTVPEPVEMLRSSWFSNPFTRGVYTYNNVDSPSHPTARSDLASPLLDAAGAPRLLFAGEATEPTRFSTVHGAIDSGRREAMRLLPAATKI